MPVVWEEPKQTSKRAATGSWKEEAAQLRPYPGRWGVIAVYSKKDHRLAYALAGHIRGGGYVAFRPKGAFEAHVQTEANGSRKVFARFVGGATKAHGKAGGVAVAKDAKRQRNRRTAAAEPVDAKPVSKRRSTQRRAENPAPGAAQETVADGGDAEVIPFPGRARSRRSHT